MHVIQGPTLVNPFSFETVDELRRELDNANHVLLTQFLALSEARAAIEQMAGAFDEILLAHLRGEATSVSELLAAYLASRSSLRQHLEARIQSDTQRALH